MKLSRKNKIAVLKEAKRLLDGGKRWGKGSWFGKRRSKGLSISSLNTTRPDAVLAPDVCYCLDGALEAAAVSLGFVKRPKCSLRTANAVSINGLAMQKGYSGSMGLNDARYTTYSKIEKLINERIEELETGRA